MSEKKPPRYYVRKRLLEIREQAHKLIETADAALADIANVERGRVYRWRCVGCGYVRFFAKLQTVEVCEDRPRCQNKRSVPGGVGATLSD